MISTPQNSKSSTDRYRQITFDAYKLDANTDAAIASLNEQFNPHEFYVVRNGDTLCICLRQVNVGYLADVIAQVSKTHGNEKAMYQILTEIKNIKSYGINGKKRLYVGYNSERKVAERKEKEKQRGKHYYANTDGFSRSDNPLPSEFSNQIVCGDSEDILKKLPPNCIDLIFTSPPYNFGIDYQTSDTDDAIDWHAYFSKLFRVFDECIRVLKYGGRIIVNIQPLYSDYIPSHHIISNYFIDKGLIWKGEILWEKNNYNCKYTAWGSWKSPSSPYLKYTWEFLEIFCKGSLKKQGDSINADIDADSFKEWVTAKWSIAPERQMHKFGHPAMFPIELARRTLLLFSFRGDTVLDPFAGTGTTCLAAKQNGRHFLGLDISPDYCTTAEARLNEELNLWRV